jgi:regulator of protease activity HflC (stomatin/prohibitin superfamily)
MGIEGILFFLIIIGVVTFLSKGVKVVKQAEVIIVERLGSYHRTLGSGVRVIWPIIDAPRPMHRRTTKTDFSGATYIITQQAIVIDLREAVFDFPRQNVITKDNISIGINAILYYQIVDPVRAVYEIANLPEAIEKLTQTTLRNVIGDLDLDGTLVSRDTINTKLRVILDEATNKWGVKINRVEIQDIIPPKDIQDAMEKQMRAERDRRATILTAEGEKTAAILKAEGQKASDINRAQGQKTSAILRAEGEAESKIKTATAEAEAIKLISGVVSEKSDPVNYLIAMKYIETLKEISSGDKNKLVYMPYEATGVLSSLGGIKEMLSQGK